MLNTTRNIFLIGLNEPVDMPPLRGYGSFVITFYKHVVPTGLEI